MKRASFLLIAVAAVLLADGPVVKTGQTTVYKQGDDGTYQAGIARSYTRTNGVVKDNATGLEWQDDYSDNGGTIKKDANWEDAKTYCANLTLDDKNDWRLPSIEELVRITDKARMNPAIDSTFVIVGLAYDYWSSTVTVSDSNAAWFVGFNDGHVGWHPKYYGLYVRCVRSRR